MILITLGTQDKSFVRLLEKVDELIDKKVINERVVVQAGFTEYKSKNMEVFNLIPRDEFDNLIKESRYIITHGGVGTILTAINNNKKVIGVPRLKKYKEHVNDHQVELIEKFSDDGYIIGVTNLDDLETAIKMIQKFNPKKFESSTYKLIKNLEKDIKKFGSRQIDITARIIFLFTILIGLIILIFK